MITLLVLAILSWRVWYSFISTVTTLASSHLDRRVLYIAPPTCLLLLFVTGIVTASHPVGFLVELIHFFSEALLLSIAVWSFPWFGISPLDDVAERRNHFAGWAIAGALLGITLEVAKIAPETTMANGRWTEDFTWKLSDPLPGTIAFLGLWAIFGKLTSLSEAITVDRDGGAALRLAAFLTALGILLGQALLELSPLDQSLFKQPQSWSRVLRMASPVVLLFFGVLIELARRTRRPGHPNRADGSIAVSYVAGSILWTYVTA